jgi:hypothetical protein
MCSVVFCFMSLNNALSQRCLEVLSKTKRRVSQICCRVEANGGRPAYATRVLVTDSFAALFNEGCYRKQTQHTPTHVLICNIHKAVTWYVCTLTWNTYSLIIKTKKCTNMYCFYSKTHIKTLKKLLHVSIYRSSSGITCSSLLNYVKC